MELRFAFSLFILLACTGIGMLFMGVQAFHSASETLSKISQQNNEALYNLNVIEPVAGQ